MNKYTIIHATATNFDADEIEIANFDRIADISANNIQEAYNKSQNIESSWLKNEGVEPYGIFQSKNVRSTSVGDLIYSRQTDKYYMVEMIGFSEVKIMNNVVIKVLKFVNCENL